MINIKGARLGEKDLLAFCNELNAELGGNGKEGLKFGIDKNGDAWIFGIKIKRSEDGKTTAD